MSRSFRIAVLASTFVACATPTPEEETYPGEVEDPADVAQSTTAADEALVVLKADVLEDPEFADSMGLSATSTLEATSLTKLIVRLDELQAWEPGTPVGTLFRAVGIRLFLVTDGADVVSAMVMGKNPDGSWRVVSEGHRAHAPRVAAARAQAIAELGEPTRPMFIIHAPALYAEFVTHRRDSVLHFVPTVDVAGLTAGTPVLAEDAILALQAMPAPEFSGTN